MASSTWKTVEQAAEEKLTELHLSGDDVSKRLIQKENDYDGSTFLTLPDELFELSALTSLEISDTALDSIEYDFAKLTNLEKLLLPRNEISASTEAFNALPKLKHMDLSYNNLQVLPEYLTLNTIEVLDVSYNQLFNLGNLSWSEQLTTLRLEFNNLRRLPEGLMFIPTLREVNISHNRFKEFPLESVQKCAALTNLDISHNEVSVFPPELSKCRQLKTLKIDGNPIYDETLKSMVTHDTEDILNYLATITK